METPLAECSAKRVFWAAIVLAEARQLAAHAVLQLWVLGSPASIVDTDFCVSRGWGGQRFGSVEQRRTSCDDQECCQPGSVSLLIRLQVHVYWRRGGRGQRGLSAVGSVLSRLSCATRCGAGSGRRDGQGRRGQRHAPVGGEVGGLFRFDPTTSAGWWRGEGGVESRRVYSGHMLST